MHSRFSFLLAAACLVISACSASTSHAAVYGESISGDLSGNKAAPTPFSLTSGSNMVTGTVNGSTDSQDWIAVTVPAGFRLSGYTNVSYSGADAQGFTGFNTGSSFTLDPSIASSYAGYSHFGSGATNGFGAKGVNNGNPTTTVGVDLFSSAYMPNNATGGGTAEGATGFTPPLAAGTYTFLIQQLGGSISYEFNFNVTAVPEPATLGLIVSGGSLLVVFAARRRAKMRHCYPL